MEVRRLKIWLVQMIRTKKIAKVDFTFPEFFSEGAKDVIGKLLKRDPKRRLPLPEVLQHPWIVKGVASTSPMFRKVHGEQPKEN